MKFVETRKTWNYTMWGPLTYVHLVSAEYLICLYANYSEANASLVHTDQF